MHPHESKTESWWHVSGLIAGINATPVRKYFLTLAHRHTNRQKGHAWASQQTLAREMCISVSTVERLFRWGKDKGIVGVRRVKTGKGKDDQYNQYWLVIDRLQELQRQVDHPSPMRGAGHEYPSDWVGATVKSSIEHPSNGDRAPLVGKGEVVEVKQSLNNSVATSVPACSVGLRQDYASMVAAESEKRPNGGASVFPLAVRQDRNRLPRGAPPVMAFIAKNGKLPPYVEDESQLLVDDDGNYAGYVGRDGKRYNEWNEYESIEMASQRRSNDAIRKVRMAANARIRENETVDSETPSVPRELTGEEKLQMLRLGAADPEQAEAWSKRTGVPANVYLEKGDHARADAYRQWKTNRDNQNGKRRRFGAS